MELLTTFTLIAIVGLMLFPAMDGVKQKIEAARCTTNLRGLHVGASAYVDENHRWPQIPLLGTDAQVMAKDWVKALEPYGVTHEAWICPTIQKVLENPDFKSEEGYRIDYFSTPFDARPRTPFLLTRQPWFAERGNMHGKGNLMVFADGSVKTLKEVMAGQGRVLPLD